MRNFKQLFCSVLLVLLVGIFSNSYAQQLNGAVYLMAYSGNNIYVSGDFTAAGSVSLNGMAKWDGTQWSPLGLGFSSSTSYINAMICDAAGNLYVGGNFSSIGGVAANNIAKWNGTAWSAVGGGINPVLASFAAVDALAVDANGNLYAGGAFEQAGTTPANNIAKWDGTNWTNLGTGIDIGGGVNSIVIDPANNIYAGGLFNSPAVSIAKWDGTSWSALGNGIESTTYQGDYPYPSLITKVIFNNNNLYVCGAFESAIGVMGTEGIAKYGSNGMFGFGWQALGTGLTAGISGGILKAPFDMTYDNNNNIYVSSLMDGVHKWDGSSWSMPFTDFQTIYPSKILNINGVLYVCGIFTNLGSQSANYIAKYGDGQWLPINATTQINNTESNNVKIYPNPSSNIFNVDAKDIKNIKVMDINGKIVFENNTNLEATQIDLTNCKSGIYFVEIQTNNTVVNTKIVKN